MRMASIKGVGQITLTDLNDVLASATPPPNPPEGALWWNTNDNKLYVYQGGAWIFSGEGIEIGGRNLIANTNHFNGKTGWSWAGTAGTSTLGEEPSSPYGLSIRATFTASGTGGGIHKPPINSLTVGKKYTWNVYLKGSKAMNLNVGAEQGGQKVCALTTSWQRFSHSFTATSSQYTSFTFYVSGAVTSGDEYWIHSLMLEEGDIPSTWQAAPEDTESVIEDIIETIGNMANDSLINYEERKVVKEELAEIIGYILADTTTTLPTTATNDAGTSGKGTFYYVRNNAIKAGLPTNDTSYVAVATKYDALKTYLEGLTPIDPWDLRTTNQDTNITVVKDTFRQKWLDYYQAELDLANATTEQLKKNVDDIVIGGTNYISNGNFGQTDLTKPLWKDSYTGQVKEVVDISTETPPFHYAYHVKNTTNANGGIFTPTVFDGVIAEKLVDKEITVSFWLKYQNIVQGANTWNLGRFGEVIIEGETATATKVYRYPRIVASGSTEGAYISGTNMTWTKYTGTIKLSLPSTTTKLTRISFKHGLEGCTGEFWTTGLQLEFGNKATDWSPNPLDLEDRISKAEFKVTDDQIMASVTAHATYQARQLEIDNSIGQVETDSNTYTDKKSSVDEGLIFSNYNFGDWTGTNPTGYSGLNGTQPTKVVSDNSGGNAWKFTTVAGTQSYLSIDASAKPYTQYAYVEATFKLESGSINGAGLLFRYYKADGSTTLYDNWFKLSDFIASPVVNKWYTVSKVVKMGLATTTDFSKYRLYVMGSWSNFDATNPAKVLYYDAVKARPATAEEIKAYEAKVSIDDMMSDLKVTPVEKSTLKQRWDDIQAEKLQLTPQADALSLTYATYTTAYNNLNGVAPKISTDVLASMTTTYSFADTTARDDFKTKLNTYFTESQKLRKLISDTISGAATNANTRLDNLKLGGANLLKNTAFSSGTGWSGYTSLNANDYQGSGSLTLTRTNYASGDARKQITYGIPSNTLPLIKTGDEYSLSAWVYVDSSVALAGGSQNSFAVRWWKADGTFFDLPIIDISTVAKDKWVYISGVAKLTQDITGSGSSVLLSISQNGLVKIARPKLEVGNTPSAWTVAQADMDSLISGIDTVANNAKQAIDDMANDNKITPVEKQDLKQQWDVIQSEKATLDAQADAYGITTEKTNYGTAYTALTSSTPANTNVSTLVSNLTTTSDVDGAGLRTKFKDYFDKRTLLLKKISDTSKTLADDNKDRITLSLDKTNYCPNPAFDGGKNTFYTTAVAFAKADASVPTGAPKAYVGRQNQRDNYINDYFSVKEGDKFVVEGWVASTDSTQNFGLGLHTKTNAGTDNWIVSGHVPKGDGSWQYFKKTYTMGTGAIQARFFSQISATSSFGNWFFTDVRITKVLTDDAINSSTNWNNAKQAVDDMANDNLLTPVEKQQLKKEWATITAEKPSYESLGTTYNKIAERDAFVGAYNTLNTLLNNATTGYLLSMTTNTDLGTNGGSTFRAVWDDYYDKLAKLLKACSTEAKTIADRAEGKIDGLEIGGRNLVRYTDFNNFDATKWVAFNTNTTDPSGTTSVTLGSGEVVKFLNVRSLVGLANATNYGYMSAGGSERFSLVANQKYTLSFLVACHGNAVNTLDYTYIINEGGTNQKIATPAVTTQKVYGTMSSPFALTVYEYSVTFTATYTCSTARLLIGSKTSADFTSSTNYALFYVARVKLEQGTQKTVWTLAPEDVDANIKKAQDAIDDMANDMKVTPLEKDSLKLTWDDIQAEYGQLSVQATSLSVTKTAYDTAYTALDGSTPKIATDILASMGTTYTFTTTGNRDAFKSKITTYYSEAQKLRKALLDAVNGKADTAQNTANTAIGHGLLTNNPIFAKWTGTYPYGYASWSSSPFFSKETTLTKNGGYGARFNVTTASTQTGLQLTTGGVVANQSEPDFVIVEVDFMLVSGVLAGAGLLVDWGGYSPTRRAYINLSSEVPSPVLNKWYTVRKVVPNPKNGTGTFTGMTGYMMGNYTTGLGTMSNKDIIFDRWAIREPSAEEVKAYNSDLAIADMVNDNKLTPLEKHSVKNELDIITVEKPTFEARGTQYNLGTEKTDYTSAYTTLYNYVNPFLSNMSTTSDINGGTMRTYFKNYYDKKAILEREIMEAVRFGGRNLVRNSTFNKYDKDGVVFNWNNGTAPTHFTLVENPESDKLSSNIMSINKTGLSADGNYQMWSDPTEINADGSRFYVISFDVKVATLANVDSGAVIFSVRTFDDATKTAQVDSAWNDSIVKADITAIGATDGKWVRYTQVIRPTAGKYIKVAPYLTRNGNVFWREIKLELGNKPSEWTQAPEDVEDFLYTLESRISTAEQKITSDAIISTVTSSTTFTNIMDGKANSDDVANNYSSKEELEQAKADLQKYTDGEIENIDLSAYVTQTQLEQESSSLTAKFVAGGGVNLVKNSTGLGDFNFWTRSSTLSTRIAVVNNSTLDKLGFSKGFDFPASDANRSIEQDIYVTAGQEYTLSWFVNKTNVSSSADNNGSLAIQFLEGVTTMQTYRYNSEVKTNGYEQGSMTYTPQSSIITVRIYGYINCDATIAGLMLNIGGNALQWTMANGEIYNTNIRMDLNGIQVVQLDNGKEVRKTSITPDEFAGYYDTNGDGTLEKVFWLEEDETYSKKFKATNEITMGTIKIIKVDSATYKGWAFVPTDET